MSSMAAGPATLMQREHEELRQLMRAVEGMAGAIHHGRPPSGEEMRKLCHEAERLAERCYHRQENEAIFPALRRADPHAARQAQHIAKLHHAKEQECLDGMKRWTEAAAGGDVKAQVEWERCAHGFIRALKEHVRAEEQAVLPAMGRWAPEERERAAQRMRNVDEQVFGPFGHRVTVQAIAGLEDRYARWAHPGSPG